MTDSITVVGIVATIPRRLATPEGVKITSFRLASTQRRFDRSRNAWVDGETNWYTVTAFRQLATNAADSVQKGERVIVTGRLRIRDWEAGGKTGTNVDIEAEALGHDLMWGTTVYTRIVSTSSVPGLGEDAIDAGSGPSDAGAPELDGGIDPASGGPAVPATDEVEVPF